MSFSVSCRGCGLEYSGRRPFAQPANAARPRFLRLLADCARYLRTARRALDEGTLDGRTLDEYVAAEGFSRGFRDHFLVPLTAALWSTSPGRALEFPIAHAVRFFDHHGMLGFGRFRWRTVTGGSCTYVDAIADRLGAAVRLGAPVVAVERHADGVDVRARGQAPERFDALVVATHPDEALALLADAGDDERRLLAAIPYARNDTVLHTDERLLPAARGARASWNYLLAACEDPTERPTMTYYLNRLQSLDEPFHYCVTLNRSADIAEDRVIERIVYDHPQFSVDGLRARERLPQIQGLRRTWFCGAWQGFGFHEDGLVSGLAVARSLGVAW
jgi:predicted NAD/FAD-binding protein